jgi:hypothetical protein
MDTLQSWRGNCDVQILTYNCDPSEPDISEIARVTDYVVAYSCKGNATHTEEVQQIKNLIMHCDELTSDKNDVVRVCKKVMNEVTKKRMTSKQECMVLLAELDLVLCTETIENVSISASKRLRKADETETDASFIDKCSKRPAQHESYTMPQCYDVLKNSDANAKKRIPNFVGIGGSPVFPVTENYARHVLIVYRPWRKYPRKINWKADFEDFIQRGSSPLEARLPYRRVMLRYYNKMTYYEPKATDVDHSGNPISKEDEDIMTLCGLAASEEKDYDTNLIRNLPKGLDYAWDKEPKVSK